MRRRPKIRPEVQEELDEADLSHERTNAVIGSGAPNWTDLAPMYDWDWYRPKMTVWGKWYLCIMLSLVVAFVVIAIVSNV